MGERSCLSYQLSLPRRLQRGTVDSFKVDIRSGRRRATIGVLLGYERKTITRIVVVSAMALKGRLQRRLKKSLSL